MAESADVVIIGAGIAGLAAAQSLKKQGCTSLVVLEARHRIGGRIFTESLLGFPIDLGASWVRGTIRNPLLSLPMRLEGVDNIVIFDQCHVPIDPETSKDLINKVWEARQRLINSRKSRILTGPRSETPQLFSSISKSLHQDSEDETAAAAVSCQNQIPQAINDTTTASIKSKKTRRRQSWWDWKRLEMLRESGERSTDELSHLTWVEDIDEQISSLGSSPMTEDVSPVAMRLQGSPRRISMAGDVISTENISVRDWILEDPVFANELGSNYFNRNLMLGLISALENLEGADLDSLGVCHHDRKAYEGPHLYVADGFQQVIDVTSQSIIESEDQIIRLDHVVTLIDYTGVNTPPTHPIHVETNQGSFFAKTVISTIPLGVLKDQPPDFFNPSLPPVNANAINRLGFGLIDKIILEFPWAFWPEDLDGFWAFMPEVKRGMDFDEGEDAPGLTGFVNMERIHKLNKSASGEGGAAQGVGPPVLVAYVSQRQARRIEGMEDGEVAELFLGLLRLCFAEIEVPDLVSVRITRWEMDPFSRGACTYIPVGESTPQDIIDVGTPVPFPPQPLHQLQHHAIHFAGEHTSRNHFATVHGALLSGLDRAEKVGREMGLRGATTSSV
ncbi:hypothetical protein HDV05_008605 [Chytridiales sp. JEL 0842]|nr:hypothetical protein HDV05_008605 [Chytridiales sp. JEL 0842]